MTTILRTALVLSMVGAASAPSPAAPAGPDPIVLDGRFDDWRGDAVRVLDPPNDAIGAFDVSHASATSRGTAVYLRFNIGRTLNLQSGHADEGTLVWNFTMPDGRCLSVDLRGRNVYLGGKPEQSLGHAPARYMSAPTHAAEEFELTVDLAVMGAKLGDAVSIHAHGSDEVEPFELTLDAPPASAPRIAVERAPRPAEVIRVASLNVLHGGLTDGARRERIGRLLRAADADVFLFQEQWDTPAQAIANAMDEMIPLGRTPGWRVVASGHGTAIASRLPIRGVVPPGAAERTTVGVVDTRFGPVVTASLHLKCCGFAGSNEDLLRLASVRDLMDFFDAEFCAAGDPPRAIVGGDWNLVGSRTPMTLAGPPALEASPRRIVFDESGWPSHHLRRGTAHSIDLIPIDLRHVNGVDTHTWRNDESDFAPGRLDFITVGGPWRLIRPVGGYVLDAADLLPAELEALELEPRDSEASDHLLLVTDFDLAPLELHR